MVELSQLDPKLIIDDCPGLSIGSPLRIGGQKRVWNCAFDGKAYVLKALMGNDRALKRVEREIEILQRCVSRFLPHFGPFPLRKISVDGEVVAYFLEEYIEGLPLGSVHFPMPAEQIVSLGCCIAEALAILWQARYIHRDIKPLNIIQKTASTYILIDPGFALDLDGEALSMPEGGPVGTLYYLSPDQITMKSADLDVRSDLFSLGVTMYQAATGEHPFSNSEMPRNILENICHRQCPSPGHFVDLPDSLCKTIMKLLAKDRNARFQTPEELQHDLCRE